MTEENDKKRIERIEKNRTNREKKREELERKIYREERRDKANYQPEKGELDDGNPPQEDSK